MANKITFTASDEVADKIHKLQEELGLSSTGEVIAMGLSMLEMSMGRDVEFKDNKKTYRVSKFANLNQTIVLDDDSE